MTFFSSMIVIPLLAIIPVLVMKGLTKFQKLLLASVHFSKVLSIYFVVLFLLILTYLFLCFLCTALAFADDCTSYLLIYFSHLKLPIHERCVITSTYFFSKKHVSCFLNFAFYNFSENIGFQQLKRRLANRKATEIPYGIITKTNFIYSKIYLRKIDQ